MMPARPKNTRGKPKHRSQHPRAERLVYTVPEAGRLLGLGRNASYDAAKRGDIPTLRIGRLLLVPKIPLHRMLGITAPVPTSTASSIDLAQSAGIAEELRKDDQANLESPSSGDSISKRLITEWPRHSNSTRSRTSLDQ
jgi:hypothetical protein